MKEKKSIKKLIAFFGTVLAIMALMCTAAFAEISETDKAAIGDTGYATFDAAKNAAKDGDTITLLADAEVDRSNFDTYQIWYRITVDGQSQYGLKINGTGSVEIKVEVHFKNMVINDTATHYHGIFKITDSGHLVLENSTVTGAVGGVAGPIVSESANASVTLIGSKIDSSKRSWDNNKGTAVSMSKGGKLVIDANSEITRCQNGSEAVAVYGGPGSIEVSGKITGNTSVTDGAVYAGSGVTVTIGENAEISGNGSNKVAVRAENGATVTDNSGKYGKYGNNYYEEAIVAVSSSGAGYTDYYSAVLNASGTVYLIKDAVLSNGSVLDKNNTYTVDGQGHTLKITTGRWIIANITFKNINIDISALNGGTAFSIASGSVTLESGAVVDGKVDAKNNGGGKFCYVESDGSSFNMKEGSAIRNISYTASATGYGGAVRLNGGVFNMEGGTISDVKLKSSSWCHGGAIALDNTAVFNMTGGKITGCSANEGGVLFLNKPSTKANISGGTITDNSCTAAKGGAIFVANGTLNVSGNAIIYNNWDALGADNIYGAAENIVVNGEFSGKIGIKIESLAAGAQVATAAKGASLAKTGTVICDNGGRDYFAYIKDGKLLLTHALTLESRTDTGNYVKGEDTLGVARIITTVTDVKNPASVEYMGTLFYVNEKDKEKIDTNAYKLTDLSKLEAGNGYMADVYGIRTDTATIYAVNYYKFYGINGVVFSEPIEIGYSKSTAQTVEYTE